MAPFLDCTSFDALSLRIFVDASRLQGLKSLTLSIPEFTSRKARIAGADIRCWRRAPAPPGQGRQQRYQPLTFLISEVMTTQAIIHLA